LSREQTHPAEAVKLEHGYEGGGGMVQTMNVNAPAMTASATPPCAARADKAPSMSAPLELLPDAGAEELAAAGEPESEAVTAPDGTATRGVLAPAELVDTTKVGVAEEAGTAAGPPVVLFELVLPLAGRYDGGGTALDGSTRAPLPQGIASPSGWVAFGGGVVAPVASAMAKRPVQRRSDALWENW
jgi:hypothetical protein